MRSTSHSGEVFDIWLLATVPSKEPISIHAESEIDGGVAGAFDRLVPGLVADLRERVTGEKR
ncbi:MAG: hypothetical protein BGO26_10095 [Actinobacteria bacterium 69-20]|nr:hypothetical protein [Actinomycetota bacterium]OJV23249.1 MAG: hypothetical protein BGO26_10095 [Actinobacteria bacterium 69-20]